MKKLFCIAFLLLLFHHSYADDGYRLWLKYDLLKNQERVKEYQHFTNFLASDFSETPILQTAKAELSRGLEGLLGIKLKTTTNEKGGIFLKKAQDIPEEGFKISTQQGNVSIFASSDKGILYGVFELLRQIQTENSLRDLSISSVPRIKLRMLDHWDNVLGTIERGYAGSSLWKWYELPEILDPRYTDYARADASIGINAVAINNVNASARFLTSEYLIKVKALADIFRPYGIKVFLSVNFASPKILGKLKTSDPLDPQVRQWWQDKSKEVYQYIPDFGGFLVKANSEGEPGPQEYGRSHADGANMLAQALRPFNGIVIWRAFVYAANPNGDRFKEAYNEFKPLDGKFDANVIVQVKNGPIDFQAREPFHPLFGAMRQTQLGLEFQITQEYTGFTTNIFYQSVLFKECLSADTYAKGKGSTVANVIDGSVNHEPLTLMAGVANTGSDRNWVGHPLSQANWYAFGRLAWNHDLTSEQIAEEWIKMTLTHDKTSVKIIQNMLMKSREIYVDFTTPLGLHHIMGQNIHFGPEPWLEKSARPDWTAVYYHRADSLGLGFDRTENGSDALSLYAPEVRKQWEDPKTCDLHYLLWYHHVPWTAKLSTGRSLWDELCFRYFSGVEEVESLQKEWEKVKGTIDNEIATDVQARLAVQHREALNWRDACVLYFQTYAKLPIPAPFQPPTRTLEEMKKLVAIYQLK